jgi:hypothetical protein
MKLPSGRTGLPAELRGGRTPGPSGHRIGHGRFGLGVMVATALSLTAIFFLGFGLADAWIWLANHL